MSISLWHQPNPNLFDLCSWLTLTIVFTVKGIATFNRNNQDSINMSNLAPDTDKQSMDIWENNNFLSAIANLSRNLFIYFICTW